ncbi:hypothetical protein EDB19DRAFT_1759303 [Suillus lakei]|nr:hypothetical protein EDB19DRAFT_1759303 [Suillus lakei]
MVNWRMSRDLKDCVLTLWDHGWEAEDICEVVGISRASCFCRRNLFEELGTVARPPSPLVVRTRIIVSADLFLDEITWSTTLRHQLIILISQSQTSWPFSKMLQKIASERDDSLWNDFVGDGSEFVVLDETSKNERTYARYYGRSHHGQLCLGEALRPQYH